MILLNKVNLADLVILLNLLIFVNLVYMADFANMVDLVNMVDLEGLVDLVNLVILLISVNMVGMVLSGEYSSGGLGQNDDSVERSLKNWTNFGIWTNGRGGRGF